jgi:hypothetical protein
MNWVKDATGRFTRRPYLLPEEMDAQSEKVISDFLMEKYRKISFPVSTDDLTILVESMTQDLDLYADLSSEGSGIEGVTSFCRGMRPRVRISKELTQDPRMINRLRTTLTHELGHVFFHDHMFQGSADSGSLFPTEPNTESNSCKRDSILHAPYSDWMEWQAGFACGAFLMPATVVKDVIRAYAKDNKLSVASYGADSKHGQDLVLRVCQNFDVSKDAARVRLFKRGALSEGQLAETLF